jgi:hypothetical protein
VPGVIREERSQLSGRGNTSLSPLEAENARLKKQIRKLEQDRDILKSLSHFQPTDLKERYGFIQQHTAKWPAQVVCQVLKLSRSAYGNWLSGKTKSSNQKKN